MDTAAGYGTDPAPAHRGATGSALDQEIVNLVLAVCDEEWQRAVAAHVGDLIGDRTWRMRPSPGGCRKLAELARALLRARGMLRDAVGNAAETAMRGLDAPPPAKTLVRAIIDRATIPGAANLDQAARGLQLLGVYSCVAQGIHPSRCDCLQDLARHVTTSGLRQVLEDEFRHLASA